MHPEAERGWRGEWSRDTDGRWPRRVALLSPPPAHPPHLPSRPWRKRELCCPLPRRRPGPGQRLWGRAVKLGVRAGPGHSLGVQELGVAWAALDCFQLVAIGQRMGGSEIPTYRCTKVHSHRHSPRHTIWGPSPTTEWSHVYTLKVTAVFTCEPKASGPPWPSLSLSPRPTFAGSEGWCCPGCGSAGRATESSRVTASRLTDTGLCWPVSRMWLPPSQRQC